MQETITVPRGNNVGKAIIDFLTLKRIFTKVAITTFKVSRDTVNKTVTATITYHYSHKR